jgi:hypothetical protein
MRKLYTVSWRAEFQFFGITQGVVLGDGVTSGLIVGQQIELRRPDGQTVRTRIARVHHTPFKTQIGLDHIFVKNDVPQGTEVWLVDEDDPAPLA